MIWKIKVRFKSYPLTNFISIVDKLAVFPIGTILSWVMKIDTNGDFVELPDGWMRYFFEFISNQEIFDLRCDGTIIPHGSIWEGKTVPDLNGERRFLRGGPDSDVLKMEEDQVEDHHHRHKHTATADATVHDYGHTHDYDDYYPADPGTSVEHVGSKPSWYLAHAVRTSKKSYTGITVDVDVDTAYVDVGMSSGSHGSETRPKNMNVIYIIRIW